MQTVTRTVPGVKAPLLSTEARLLFMATLAVCVVIPHSLQAPTGALMAMTAAVCLLVYQTSGRLSYIAITYLAGAAVTCLYLIIGMMHGAPAQAVYQTLAIYLGAPLLWIIMLRTAQQVIPVDQLIRYLSVLAWAACASVALFFYLFLTRGATAVTFFVENANLQLGGGYSGATMHVYGSLIFLVSAFFAAPEVIRNKVHRILLLAALAICAVTSGRSALMISIPAGLLVGIVVRQFERRPRAAGEKRRGPGVYILFVVAIAVILAVLDRLIEDIDLSLIFESAWDKVMEGGGELRVDQSKSLWAGIQANYGFGAGHGIGASLTRNELYPWRYENVPLAVLFKTGFIGTAIYALPFFIYFSRATGSVLRGTLSQHDKFMLAGLVAVLLAATTNPYLESFIFQWMFILPLVTQDRPSNRMGEQPANGL